MAEKKLPSKHLPDYVEVLEKAAEAGDRSIVAQLSDLEGNSDQRQDGEGQRAEPLYGFPRNVVSTPRRKGFRKEAAEQENDDGEGG